MDAIFIVVINIISLILMFIDKKNSIKNKYRISEDALILIAVFGGSVGVLLSMYLFRHKTKKYKFKYGIPIIIIIQFFIIYKLFQGEIYGY